MQGVAGAAVVGGYRRGGGPPLNFFCFCFCFFLLCARGRGAAAEGGIRGRVLKKWG